MRPLRPTFLALLWSALLLLPLGACQCEDPCAGVECPTGLVCNGGDCVPPETDGGLVPECAIDADCAGRQGRTHCNGITEQCVECAVSSHCPDALTQVCDQTTSLCVARPPCTADTDCAELLGAPHCEVDSGACVMCTSSEHCAGTQQGCNPNFVCEFQPCSGDGDCAELSATPYCAAATGICQGCVTDAHCTAGDECRSGSCQPKGECSKNADCPAMKVCNSGLNPPACKECVSNADCGLGGRCASGSCTSDIPCGGDADCAAPLHCNVNTGSCTDCGSDAHCRGSQTCSNTGRCELSASCGVTEFCPEGQSCNAGTCETAACNDDTLESNDNPYDASPIETGRVNNAVLCPNTWDWFVTRASVGDGLVLDVTYEVAKGHPELLVWAGTGTGPVLVGQPTITGTGQHLEVTNLSRNGPIWIGLRGINETQTYDLDLTVKDGGLCADDGLEPNDNATAATQLEEPIAGITTADAVACFGDEDWYALTIPENLRVIATASLTDGGPAGALSTAIYAQTGGGGTTLVGGNGTETAEAPPRTQSWVALVRVTNASLGGLDYHLEVRQRPPRPSNDSCSARPQLTEGVTVAGTTAGGTDDAATGCGGDGSSDVAYRFSLASTRAVTIQTTGSLDAVLGLWPACDPADELLCADVPGGTETLQAVLPQGNYTVWVDGYSGREGAFDLTFTTADPPPPPTNESCTTAAILDGTTGGGVETGDVAVAVDDVATVCGPTNAGDAVYDLQLDSPASLVATLEGTPGVAFSVQGTCGDTATSAGCALIGADGTGTLEVPYLDTGSHTIIVDGGGLGGGAYTLTWALGSPIPPAQNDTCATAELLVFDGNGQAVVSGDTRNAQDDLELVCGVPAEGGRDVVYQFVLAADAEISASLDASWDAVLGLRTMPCESTAALMCSDAATPTLYAPSLAGNAFYYLVVDAYTSEKGPFTLTVHQDAPLAVPPNDTCAAATPLDPSGGPVTVNAWTHRAADDEAPDATCTGSSLSGPDAAWSVALAAGQTLTATVTPEPGFDPALYVLGTCGATTCLAGADQFFVSDPETVSYTAAGAETVFVVVDSYDVDEAGFFDLTVSVQ